MGAPEYIKNEQGQLKERVFYDFKILKEISAPDGVQYYIIQDPYEKRHMMESECYQNYQFRIGDIIQVRIDHINCKGQVFFEPKHPRFTENEIFDCKYLGQEMQRNKFNEEELYLKVEGPDGEETLIQTISLHQEKKDFRKDKIQCKIKKISKGKLIMSQYLK